MKPSPPQADGISGLNTAPRFIIKNFRNFASKGASVATGALGHGAVGTYPDRPFLKWRFNFKLNNRNSGWRDNGATFLEACEKLHTAFSDYARMHRFPKNLLNLNP